MMCESNTGKRVEGGGTRKLLLLVELFQPIRLSDAIITPWWRASSGVSPIFGQWNVRLQNSYDVCVATFR